MFNRLLNNPVFAGTIIVLIVGILLSVFLFVKTVGELVSWEQYENYPTRTITVEADGEILAVPDIATFNFTVSVNEQSVEDAQEIATEKINKATSFLKDNGVVETDIKTTSYNVRPQYNYNRICNELDCPPSTPEIVGYEVSQTTKVKVRQAEEAGRFLTELGNIGISNVSGLSFTIDDEDVLYEQATEKAIDNAQEKAEKLARQLGVKLGDVTSFGEDSHINPSAKFDAVRTFSMEASSAAPEISEGENSYRASVWVTYEID
jgi:uncharacterized protein YggE